MKEDRLEWLPGTLDLLVLKTLVSGPLHGYAIARRIKTQTESVLSVEEGSLYPALHRMERRGWIASEWGASEANRRAKFYRLSPAGRARLRRGARDWVRLSTAIGRVLGSEGLA